MRQGPFHRYPLVELDPATVQRVYDRFSKFLENSVTPDILTWESTETVHNRPASFRDLRNALRRLPLARTLEILSIIAVEIARGRHPSDAVLQLRVAVSFGMTTRRGRSLANRLHNTSESVLVEEEQLAMLSAYAIVHCEAKEWPQNGNEYFLDALLAYHSIKGQELQDNQDPYRSLRRIELRSTATDSQNITDVLDRWRAFLLWTEQPKSKSSKNYLDVQAIFTDAFGMGFSSWLAATWVFASHFLQIPVNKDGKFYNAFLNVDEYLAKLENTSEVRHWLEQTSIELQDAKNILSKMQTTSLAELEIFMERPLLRTPWGICCPIYRFLPNVAGNGLLFRLGKYLENTESREASDKLRGLFGDFLESYVTELLQKATVHRKTIIFKEKIYGKPEKKSSDVVLFDGGKAVFIDATITQFSLRTSVVALDDENIKKDLRNFVTNKISQIVNCVNDFRSESLRYDGVHQSDIDEIYALVVSPQSLPRFAGLSQIINTSIPALPKGICEWDYFNLNEIEALAIMFEGNLDLAGLIAEKKNDSFGKHRSLINYFYVRNHSLLRFRQSRDNISHDPWIGDVLEKTRAWGLK